jgi:hypothetical protein
MCLTGSLTDLSLAEILLFTEKGKKTGILTLFTEPVSQAKSLPVYYIWVYQGCLVAGSHHLDEQGLVRLIHQRQWVSPRVIDKLAQLCPTDKPLGVHLKNQGVLRNFQLKQLFIAQVLKPVCDLCKLQKGQFEFVQNVPLPMREMTGLSVSARVPALMAPNDTKTWRLKQWEPTFAPRVRAVNSRNSNSIKHPSALQGVQQTELSRVFA